MFKGKLPSEVVSERHQHINGLKQFVEEKKQNLRQVLQQFGLTEESLAKVEPKQLCPYDSGHFIPEKSFKKHVEKCRLLKAGYQKDQLPSQLANTDFCYEGKSSMKVELDESLINKIIWDDCVLKGEVYTGHRAMPVSHMEENSNLTQNDRLAIYHHVVNKSHEAGKVITVDKSDELLTTDWGSLVKKGLLDAQNNEKYSSKLEQLAALRDLKRRRQSYRAKNVHITKKSYTEIIREVIVNQMEVLVPAGSRSQVKETDSSEYKSRHTDRKRRSMDREEDSATFSHRQEFRNRNRGKRLKYDDEQSEERKESRRRKCHKDSDSQQEFHKNRDLEIVKKEQVQISVESVDPINKNESVDNVNLSSLNKEDNGVNSGYSTPSYRSRRTRSRSYSSSQSSSESHRHHHRKKSKHKKKSKYSKKHSKKHKR